MTDDVVIRADHVGKKFCRELKTSLWYGVKDVVSDLTGFGQSSEILRPREFWALEDVSFTVKRGECLGLIGRNGAGKTTLLKMLNGLIKPDRGRIEMHGRVGGLIALGAGFNPLLTGRENIYINGAVLGLSKKELDAKYDEIVDFADIGDFINAPVQSYSSGMQVRLGFAVAVAVKPDVMLLDEVLAVGDANFQVKCFNTLAKFREEGTAFILVSHNSHMISRYCQQSLYLRQGKSVHLGDVEDGLAMLENDMAQIGKAEVEGPDFTVARGSGRIRITGAEFLDGAGQRIEAARLGEPLTLALRYERTDPSISAIRLDIVMRTNDEDLFQGDNLRSQQPLEVTAPRGVLLVKFAYFAANMDSVNFFLTVLDPVTSQVHDWKRNLRLPVDRSKFDRGMIFSPVEWQCESEALVQ
jgi:lipopolysaccharide transport system ATP-binding protein